MSGGREMSGNSQESGEERPWKIRKGFRFRRGKFGTEVVYDKMYVRKRKDKDGEK